jgi:mediator of RNA polymerase II transcription subunit 16
METAQADGGTAMFGVHQGYFAYHEQIWPPMPDNHRIVHLAWSAMGNDLAVLDSAGRIMLYTTGFTLVPMVLTYTAMNDSGDEMNAIVGLHWLPVFPHTQKVGNFCCAH